MKRVNLSFASLEYQRLQTMAAAQGLRPGTFARSLILQAVNTVMGPVEKTETIDIFENSKKKRGKK